MKDWTAIRERYLRDQLPIRLGGLAAHLSRIKSFNQLARWQYNWAGIWSDPLRRNQMAEQSAAWSKRVLAMSGLLNR